MNEPKGGLSSATVELSALKPRDWFELNGERYRKRDDGQVDFISWGTLGSSINVTPLPDCTGWDWEKPTATGEGCFLKGWQYPSPPDGWQYIKSPELDFAIQEGDEHRFDGDVGFTPFNRAIGHDVLYFLGDDGLSQRSILTIRRRVEVAEAEPVAEVADEAVLVEEFRHAMAELGPEPPTYYPFSRADLESLIGKVVRHKEHGWAAMITAAHFATGKLCLNGLRITTADLLEMFVNLDGSPCGVPTPGTRSEGK